MAVPGLIGFVGVAAFVSAYALMQIERMRSTDPWYLALNGLGSALVLVSPLYSFNLPSFITQTLWLVFTAIGFLRTRQDAL